MRENRSALYTVALAREEMAGWEPKRFLPRRQRRGVTNRNQFSLEKQFEGA